MAQYHKIQQIPGVQVAAPIAMVGYAMILADRQVYLPAADYARPGRQLYRYTTTWVSAGGTSRIRQPPSYVYLTPARIGANQNTGVNTELVPGGSSVPVCDLTGSSGQFTPFSAGAQSASYCWSKVDGLTGSYSSPGKPQHGAYAYVVWEFPMLIAAIDPEAEAQLDGLNRAITSGSYLREGTGDGRTAGGGGAEEPTVPVLTTLGQRHGLDTIDNLGTVGPVSYRRDSNGSLTPIRVSNPQSVWQLTSVADGGVLAVPMDEADNQYRSVQSHLPPSAGTILPRAQLAGIFDPAKVRSFNPLSQVPLGPYQPVTAASANTASRKALHDGSLLPSLNLGGYVSQPVQLITTLTALPALENSSVFSGNLRAGDPISVIRVRWPASPGPTPCRGSASTRSPGRSRRAPAWTWTVLASLGWRRSQLSATVLGELAGIGLAAGMLAAAVALPVSAALGLHASPGRALLAVPVAMVVAVIDGLVPAWLAAQADPVTSVRPPVLAVRRGHQPGGITTLALLNVARTPGRTVIGSSALRSASPA